MGLAPDLMISPFEIAVARGPTTEDMKQVELLHLDDPFRHEAAPQQPSELTRSSIDLVLSAQLPALTPPVHLPDGSGLAQGAGEASWHS